MITSVRFTADRKEDYINMVRYKTVLANGVTQEEYDAARNSNTYDHTKWHSRRHMLNSMTKEVRDGYENPTLRKCVMKREFTFVPDKINVIFGPNASGKTTILKTIASHAMCGNRDGNDGYTSLTKYINSLDFFTWEVKTDDEYDKELRTVITKAAGNEAEVVWDGQPVYYENLAGRRTYNEVGNLVGGLIGSFAEEMLWHMNQKSTSAGQKTMYLISKLGSVLKKCPTSDTLIAENRSVYAESAEYSQKRADAILRYYQSHLVKTDEPYPTLLLDEMDKSLDLLNVLALYSELLPAITEQFHVQLIVVSHSPVVLLDKIYNSDKYNIISMDEKYTKACLKQMKTLL